MKKEKIVDTIFYYKGFVGCKSKCGLTITKEGKKVTVILTELPSNHGTSVTNMIEDLATMIYWQFLKDVPVENIEWIEHYPPTDSLNLPETFDRVVMKWDGKQFSHPQWKRIKTIEQ